MDIFNEKGAVHDKKDNSNTITIRTNAQFDKDAKREIQMDDNDRLLQIDEELMTQEDIKEQ
jgi:hypothetical protein